MVHRRTTNYPACPILYAVENKMSRSGDVLICVAELPQHLSININVIQKTSSFSVSMKWQRRGRSEFLANKCFICVYREKRALGKTWGERVRERKTAKANRNRKNVGAAIEMKSLCDVFNCQFDWTARWWKRRKTYHRYHHGNGWRISIIYTSHLIKCIWNFQLSSKRACVWEEYTMRAAWVDGSVGMNVIYGWV